MKADMSALEKVVGDTLSQLAAAAMTNRLVAYPATIAGVRVDVIGYQRSERDVVPIVVVSSDELARLIDLTEYHPGASVVDTSIRSVAK